MTIAGDPWGGPVGPRGVSTVRQKPAWMDEGLCFGCDPELWYPGRGDNATLSAAKAICAACPHRETCLEHALEVGEKWGVWGGKSERERRRIRSKRRLARQAARTADAADVA